MNLQAIRARRDAMAIYMPSPRFMCELAEVDHVERKQAGRERWRRRGLPSMDAYECLYADWIAHPDHFPPRPLPQSSMALY